MYIYCREGGASCILFYISWLIFYFCVAKYELVYDVPCLLSHLTKLQISKPRRQTAQETFYLMFLVILKLRKRLDVLHLQYCMILCILLLWHILLDKSWSTKTIHSITWYHPGSQSHIDTWPNGLVTISKCSFFIFCMGYSFLAVLIIVEVKWLYRFIKSSSLK